MNSYLPEQRVVAEVSHSPALTVESWTVLPQRCLDLDWSRITFLALQHRVEGLLYDALDLAGIAEQIPATAVSTLARRARLAEARHGSFMEALTELARRAPDQVAGMVFFKGARLMPLYASPRHRGLARKIGVGEIRAGEAGAEQREKILQQRFAGLSPRAHHHIKQPRRARHAHADGVAQRLHHGAAQLARPQPRQQVVEHKVNRGLPLFFERIHRWRRAGRR